MKNFSFQQYRDRLNLFSLQIVGCRRAILGHIKKIDHYLDTENTTSLRIFSEKKNDDINTFNYHIVFLVLKNIYKIISFLAIVCKDHYPFL